MVQTGVPFGEIEAVVQWMHLSDDVDPPPRQHPRRPVHGFSCPRSEVSGRRFWGLMAQVFGSAESFFADHYVGNYCPLAFLEDSGKNRTPVALRSHERRTLFDVCDRHLVAMIDALHPQWLVGVGTFALQRLQAVHSRLEDQNCTIGVILHPSPANPHANRGWGERAAAQLVELGVWPKERSNR